MPKQPTEYAQPVLDDATVPDLMGAAAIDTGEPEVDVVVVAYNGGDALRNTVGTILGSRGVHARVILVDNASTDGSCEPLRGSLISVVSLAQNVGYGGGFNIGLARAQGPWVACANQDIELHPDALRTLIDTADGCQRERNLAGIVGPRITRRGGSMTEAAHRIPSYWDEILDLALGLGRSRNAFAGSTASARPVECEWVSAVFLVGHKSTFERIRGFDPEYFMYVEDLDLFRRLRDNGGLCLWDPRASVIHHGGVDAESRGAISAELYALTIWNIRRYFEKHEPSWKEWRGRSLLLAGALGCFLRGASWGWRGAAERARRVTRGKPWPDTLALARMFTIAGWLCAKASVSCRLPSRIQDHLLLLRGPDLPKIS